MSYNQTNETEELFYFLAHSKYTKEEIEEVIEVLNGDTTEEDIKKYIDDSKLLEEYCKVLDEYKINPEIDTDEITDKIYTYIVERVSIKDVPILAKNSYLLDYFLSNPELVSEEPIPNEITAQLISNVADINTLAAKQALDEISMNPTKWGMTKDKIQTIKDAIELKSLDNQQDNSTFSNLNYESQDDREAREDMEARKLREKLGITEDELFAIKVYEGVAPHKAGRESSFSSSHTSYEAINALLFPGMLNEAVRCCEDGKTLNVNSIEEADEMLRIVTDIYSAMCKYSKAVESNQSVSRLDRSMSYDSMKRTGTTNSFASCSFGKIQGNFKKAHVTIFHMDVEPGAKCADFRRILGPSNYSYKNERELLIAPYATIEMEEIDRANWTNEERNITDLNGGQADRCIKAKVKAGEPAKPLTPEEKKAQQEAMTIFYDPNLRKKASTALIMLNGNYGKNPHDVIYTIPSDVRNGYLEWKNAYHTVLKFRMREIELQVDKQFENQQDFTIESVEEPKQQFSPQETNENCMNLYKNFYDESLTATEKIAIAKKVAEDIKQFQESEKKQSKQIEDLNKKNVDKENSER